MLLIALTFRLLAAFFAPGYLMHDDHFLTIEPAAGWAQGADYIGWFNWNLDPNVYDHGAISFTYPGLLAGLFKILNALGIVAPQSQMLIIRILHSLFSLWVVFFGYRITERLSNKKNAVQVGLILALLFFLPNFSVRNLVEMVCIPFIMGSVYLLLRYQESLRLKTLLYAALIGGLAVGFRYQIVLITAFLGFVLLFQNGLKAFLIYGFFAMLGFSITQLGDIYVFGEPFTQIQRYIAYNSAHKSEYITLPWFTYIGTLLLFMLPPASLMLLFGFFRQWRKNLLIFLPVIVFLAFHSYYPNKQERFILPILPFIIITGTIGWNSFIKTAPFWLKRPRLNKGLWVTFWILNTIGLGILSFSYGKKARVEALTYLYEQGDLQAYLQEHSADEASQAPQFYCGKWNAHYEIGPKQNFDNAIQGVLAHPNSEAVNYLLFYSGRDLEKRVSRAEAYFPQGLIYQAKTEGSWFDKTLFAINPINKLEEIYIYKVANTPPPALPETE